MNNDTVFSEIPLDAISKGRDMGEVLTFYMTSHERASEIAAETEISGAEAFAKAMQAAVYRIYLLGVQDGMK